MTMDHQTPGKDPVAQLIQAAGEEEHIDNDIQKRVYVQVQQQWRRTCSDNFSPHKSRIGWWFSIPITAVVLLSMFFLINPNDSQTVAINSNQIVASVEVLKGSASIVNAKAYNGESGKLVEKGGLIYGGQTITTSANSGLGLTIGQSHSLRLDQSTLLLVQDTNNFILKKGAVYFDSGKKNTNSYITVHTDRGRFTDIGTQFELRLINEDVRLRVREGEVAFKAKGLLGKRIQVTELKEVRMTPSAEPVFSDISANGATWQWAQTLANDFKLEDSDLDEFLRWLARENGWQLRYSDNRIALKAASIKLKGSVAGIYGEQALAAVCATTSLTCRLDKGTILVSEL